MFSTTGRSVLGLSSNVLLSVISIVVGGILVAAGLRGGRTASTVLVVIDEPQRTEALQHCASSGGRGLTLLTATRHGGPPCSPSCWPASRPADRRGQLVR